MIRLPQLNTTICLLYSSAAMLVLNVSVPTAVADEAYRQAMAKAVRNAANVALPSVVSIEIIGAGDVGEGEVEQDAPTSGIIVDPDGFVLASSIVVRRPSASILVVLSDGTRHAAKVVARDHHRDLVLLKIDPDDPLSAVKFPAESELKIGQTTVAVGRYGSDASPIVSRGVLSATERLDGIALQTDARVSPAFYGGPLIDLYGQVLGVLIPAVAKGGAEDSTSWYDSGIAFAIPSDVIAKKLDRLKAGDDVTKGLIGIVSKTKDPYDDGTEIAAVRKRSPAESAGIKAGDEVLEVAGRAVRRHQEIRQVLGAFDAGESITLKLRRDGKVIEIETELAESIPPLQPQRLGIIASEQANSEDQDSVTVVVADVLPDSPADGKLKPGDQIQRVGESVVSSAESLRRLMISAEPDVQLSVSIVRDDADMQVTLTPASIAGDVFATLPKAWTKADDSAWESSEIKLPDAGNVAAFAAPSDSRSADNQADDDAEDNSSADSDEADADENVAESVGDQGGRQQLGLLVLLMNPGQGAPDKVLESWIDDAQAAGVVVCAIAPEDSRRWQPKEMDAIANFVAAISKKAPIDSTSVAIAAPGALAGGSAEAADSMALAVAMSQSSTFFGVSVSSKTRPPAVRLRENEPSASLQILLPVESKSDLPTWGAAIEKSGYPIVLGGETDRPTLLNWVRLLQAI
ncbi:MAG: trypsin-like peptidase domain-containing protein [Rubripirellula sp.]